MAPDKGSAAKGKSGISRRRAKAQARGDAQYSTKRDALIRAAADEFIEVGYDATSVSDIAARVDTDRATFYYYFESKEQLFEEVVGDVTESNLRTAREILAVEDSARERLGLLIEKFITSYIEHYPLVYLYIQEELHKLRTKRTGSGPTIRKQVKEIESIVNKIIAEAAEQGDFRDDVPTDIAMHGLFGMMNWTHRWLRPGGKYDPKQVSTAFIAIFMDGMSTQASS